MRHLIALLFVTLMASRAAKANQLTSELDDYMTAGSDHIYLQPNSTPDRQEELVEENDQIVDLSDKYDANKEQIEEAEIAKPSDKNNNNNIEAIGENELSCEYSCPRYYRPVCVSRSDKLITYATPCEFFNQLRCANVAKRQGKNVPTFQLLYHNACKQKTH